MRAPSMPINRAAGTIGPASCGDTFTSTDLTAPRPPRGHEARARRGATCPTSSRRSPGRSPSRSATETVVVNLYRPRVGRLPRHDRPRERGRAQAQLLGQVRAIAEWQPLLDERFQRRGAYVVPAGEYDWSAESDASSYIPDVEPGDGSGRLAARGRALRADAPLGRPPARHPLGRRAGQPAAPARRGARRARRARRPRRARGAVSQEAAEAARHRLALERLLDVSSRLTAEPRADEILRAVCSRRARRARLPERARRTLHRPAERPPRAARRRRLAARGDRR